MASERLPGQRHHLQVSARPGPGAPLAERVHAGHRVERFRGTADLPSFLRAPYGPGWALVGDGGCRVDPYTGQGVTDAFRDAQLLADALTAGIGGSQPLPAALAEYHRARDAAVLPIFRYTCHRARLEPPSIEMQRLLAALQHNQREADRFVGVVAGTIPFAEFYAAENVARVIGETTAQAA